MRLKINVQTGFAMLMAALSTSALLADDYTLAAGASDTLSVAATYDTMAVNGELTVSGGVTINASAITMAGGAITVTGSGTTLGNSSADATYSTTLSMTNGADGAYGVLKSLDVGNSADKGLAICNLYIRKEGDDFVSDNGYFDFLVLSNGNANIRSAYNYSSATGRITVAGTSYIWRRPPRQSQAIFRRGAYRVELVDNASLVFHFAAQGGHLNASDCVVDVGGAGSVSLRGSYESASYCVDVNRGAVFNHNGPLSFVRFDNTRNCYFALNDSNVIGPNVTALRQTGGTANYETRIAIASGVTISLCGDVAITGTRAYLTGGRLKVDATDAARSFKCNLNSGDPIVIEKVGANEMTVSATTNIPNLVVGEGVVRFEEDCVIGSVTIAAGASVIADGCEVTLSQDEIVGAALQTVNGGRFVMSGSARTMIYDPTRLSGAFHVAGGETVFSKYGFGQKWWRWTFFSVKNGPHALMHRGLYLYGPDGSRQNPDLGYVSTAAQFDNPPATALAAGKCRWWYHSATNLTKNSSYSYCSLSYLAFWFEYTHAGNNLATLSSPVIDPDNPVSHVGVEMHLAATATPIVGYNMRTHSATYYADGWKVEASNDGLNWETVEIRSNQTYTISGAYYSYDNVAYTKGTDNNKEFFHFTNYRIGGLAAMESPLSVQIDGGGTLDLLAFDDGQEVDAITVDLAAGAGTLRGGRIVANGTLTLTGVEEAGADITLPLPLAFDGTADTENFATWTVVIDGKVSRRHPVFADGRLAVPCLGFALSVR